MRKKSGKQDVVVHRPAPIGTRGLLKYSVAWPFWAEWCVNESLVRPNGPEGSFYNDHFAPPEGEGERIEVDRESCDFCIHSGERWLTVGAQIDEALAEPPAVVAC